MVGDEAAEAGLLDKFVNKVRNTFDKNARELTETKGDFARWMTGKAASGVLTQVESDIKSNKSNPEGKTSFMRFKKNLDEIRGFLLKNAKQFKVAYQSSMAGATHIYEDLGMAWLRGATKLAKYGGMLAESAVDTTFHEQCVAENPSDAVHLKKITDEAKAVKGGKKLRELINGLRGSTEGTGLLEEEIRKAVEMSAEWRSPANRPGVAKRVAGVRRGKRFGDELARNVPALRETAVLVESAGMDVSGMSVEELKQRGGVLVNFLLKGKLKELRTDPHVKAILKSRGNAKAWEHHARLSALNKVFENHLMRSGLNRARRYMRDDRPRDDEVGTHTVMRDALSIERFLDKNAKTLAKGLDEGNLYMEAVYIALCSAWYHAASLALVSVTFRSQENNIPEKAGQKTDWKSERVVSGVRMEMKPYISPELQYVGQAVNRVGQACRKGNLAEVISSLTGSSYKSEAMGLMAAAFLTTLGLLPMIIRFLTHMWYASRKWLAEHAKAQASFLRISANMAEARNPAAAEKQRQEVIKFTQLAQKLEAKMEDEQVEVRKDMRKENDEIRKQRPDAADRDGENWLG